MAYRVYAAVIDDGVYANPTTFWLEVGTWAWHTRNYVAGTWTIDASIGGVVDSISIDYSQESLVTQSAETDYFPYSIPAILCTYSQQDLLYMPHEWVPSLYFNVVVIANTPSGISSSFYGDVAYSSEANLIRT